MVLSQKEKNFFLLMHAHNNDMFDDFKYSIFVHFVISQTFHSVCDITHIIANLKDHILMVVWTVLDGEGSTRNQHKTGAVKMTRCMDSHMGLQRAVYLQTLNCRYCRFLFY